MLGDKVRRETMEGFNSVKRRLIAKSNLVALYCAPLIVRAQFPTCRLIGVAWWGKYQKFFERIRPKFSESV
jgi:hypothetical protein